MTVAEVAERSSTERWRVAATPFKRRKGTPPSVYPPLLEEVGLMRLALLGARRPYPAVTWSRPPTWNVSGTRSDAGQPARASTVRGQRRTVAARGEWVSDLTLARLRVREVQALEIVRIGDRDLEPRRVGVDELARGKEQAELLLPRRASGQAWIREPAVRIGRVGWGLVVAVEDDTVEENAGADDRSRAHIRRGPVCVAHLEDEILGIGGPCRVGLQPDARGERLRASLAVVPIGVREQLLECSGARVRDDLRRIDAKRQVLGEAVEPGTTVEEARPEIASLSAKSPRKLDSRAMSTMGPPGTFSRP